MCLYFNFVLSFQDAPLSFFVRQEHHLQYFLLKLASNLVRNQITFLVQLNPSNSHLQGKKKFAQCVWAVSEGLSCQDATVV